MLAAVKDAYADAAKLINADGIIPSGEALLLARNLGASKIHRDTTHASLGVGRYILALTWYKYLTGSDISANSFHDFDEPVDDCDREIAIKAVNETIKNLKK